jgi:hypothetical protein
MPSTFNPHAVCHFLLASATLLAAGATAAPRLLPAQAGDLAPNTLSAPAAKATPDIERQPVAMSWAAEGAIVTAPGAFVGQSREYYREVSGDELAAGIDIHTTSPRALVRLQPVGASAAKAAPIDPQGLIISDAAGRAYANASGMEMMASAEQVRQAGLGFGAGTSAFRVNPSLGAGTLKLRAASASGGQRYLVNVVEPDSPYALTLQTDAPAYLHGQVLSITPDLVELEGTRASRRPLSKLSGLVTSPAGRQFPVTFKQGRTGRLQGQLTLVGGEATMPGLWEVHAAGQAQLGGRTVERSLRVAFAVAAPVARFNGEVTPAHAPGSVGLRFGVDAAAAGRYEVRGLLYGMVSGTLQPVAVAHSAQWLEAGRGGIVLSFRPELLAGASGPFELRDLQLIDQGRMGVLQRQQRAVVLSDSDLPRSGAQATAARPQPKQKRPPVNG